LPAQVGTPIVDSVPGLPVLAPVVVEAKAPPAIKVEAHDPVRQGDGLQQVDPKFIPQVDIPQSGVVVPTPVIIGGQVRIEVDTRSPVVIATPVIYGPEVDINKPVVDAITDSPVVTPGVTGDVLLHEAGYAYKESRDPVSRRRRRRKKA
jgi:hypothetical protein